MFPNLRLMLSASLAIIVLVAIVGSSLMLFRPPPARMVDMADIVRPGIPIADDSRPALRFDAGARRNSELQRLLTLPSGPARAYAAEPPATFPYEVTTAANTGTADMTAASVDAPPAIGVAVIAAPATAASSPAEPEAIEPEAAPATAVAVLPEPALPPEPTAVAAPEPVEASVTGSNPDTLADVAAPAAGIETVPVSSIPAVDDAPIPRPKPQLALADPKLVAEKSDDQQAKASQPHRAKAKARPRRHATLSRRIKRPLPPPSAFESQQGQFPFFDNGAAHDADGRQGDWSLRTEPRADQASAGRSQRRGYAIQPPTALSR